MRQVQVGFRLYPSQLEAVDRVRGDVPRERWIRRLVTDALARLDPDSIPVDPATMAPIGQRSVEPPMSREEADAYVERLRQEAASAGE